MALGAAGPARLVRCGQKDELYQSGLRSGAGTALHGIAGNVTPPADRCCAEVTRGGTAPFLRPLLRSGLPAARCLTAPGGAGSAAGDQRGIDLGYQTLGEEYVNIVQVDSTKKRVPSFLRRAIFVSLHTVVPYYLEKGLQHLEHELQIEDDGARTLQSNPALGLSSRTLIRNWIQKQVRELTEQQKKTILQVVYILKQSIPLLRRLHLAAFYIHGTFYHLSKRIAGIRYVHFGGLQGEDQSIRSSYKFLGIISLFHLLLTIGVQIYSFQQKQRARQEWKLHRNLALQKNTIKEKATGRQSRCTLCLEERRHATATPCGHLFCWECITEWCNTRTECPLCREKFHPQKLIYLRHYQL